MPTELVDSQRSASMQTSELRQKRTCEVPDKGVGSLPTEEMIKLIRDATNSPSVLIRFLERDTLRSPSSHLYSKPPKGHRKHPSGTDLSAVGYGDRERITAHLGFILQATADCLKHETCRADEAVARAEYAEVLAKEWFAKTGFSGEGSKRSGYECNRVTKRRCKVHIAQLEKRCAEAERSASKARSEARELKTALSSLEARRKGWEEGVKIGMMKRLGEEQNKLWSAGYAEGFKEAKASAMKEGIRIGRREGLHEGREQGRNEERRSALEAFDKFLAEEMNGYGHWDDWTRRWAASVYHPDTSTSLSSRHSLLSDE
ncbi:uncharacterized protein EV420DRAFT_1478011 [Desarmillaria tabescens]|uniref:Essential protein Yae1 N-terminal domain-containing protein n=1 Tax=Armillaria tabescens TaxID=1929756 RepID=A0AA39N8Y2_ARMTA|nr:uncharacterized protein EV420DRAFT_1478011 [Desarmillaria tabescens]KAK0461199.1 hypothetical protein EV420DRAFT_1478011 [Desarmillaria tabescens]